MKILIKIRIIKQVDKNIDVLKVCTTNIRNMVVVLDLFIS